MAYQRGFNHRERRGRRRVAAAPVAPYSDQRQGRRTQRGRYQTFRTKEVVLLPESKTNQVLRPPGKANLMEKGFVHSELVINKGWSDKEVVAYFEQCFIEKLSSPMPSTAEFSR